MPKPLVVLPQSRTAPAALLAELRSIDPVAELVYFGDGKWVLGRVVPSETRRAKGARMVMWERRSSRPDMDTLRLGLLAQQGFAYVAEYQIQGEPDQRIVQDFRVRDFLFRIDPEGTFRARLSESAGEPAEAARMQKVREAMRATAPDAYRWAFNKPVSVMVH